ncbi:MAG: hypothetical protein AAGA03_00405 [Planctomycetota bacterium]
MTPENWIEWIHQRRRDDLTTPLKQLVLASVEITDHPGFGDQSHDRDAVVDQLCQLMPIARWVDLVCTDLILRHRGGEPVAASEYFHDLPFLQSGHRLDLIDAELCVRRERGETLSVTHWRQRYGEFGDSIDQLFAIPVESLGDVGSGAAAGNLTPIASAALPVPLPKNVRRGEVIRQDRDRLLVRGRDRETRRSVAMKAVSVSGNVNDWMDACEKASEVRHPNWVRPRLATSGQGWLATIRPWIFGVRYVDWVRGQPSLGHRRQLAKICFALQAVHDAGGFHGSVTAGNLWVDHHGELRLMDAVTNISALAPIAASTEDQVRRDVHACAKLCRRVLPAERHAQWDALAASSCVDIGEQLLRMA